MNMKEVEARLTVLTQAVDMMLRELPKGEQEDLIGRLEDRAAGDLQATEIVRELEGMVLRTGPYADGDLLARRERRRRVFGYDEPSSDDLKG